MKLYRKLQSDSGGRRTLSREVPTMPRWMSLGVWVLAVLSLHGLSATASDHVLYAVGSGSDDGSSNLFTIDNYSTSPTARDIGETGELIYDIAIHPRTGTIYGIRDDWFYELDATSGAATYLGRLNIDSQNALEFDEEGNLYSWGYQDTQISRVNPLTLTATPIGSTGFRSDGDLAFDENGTIYGSSRDNGGVLVRINQASGIGTEVGTFGQRDLYGLEVDADGVLYAGQGNENSHHARLYRVNKSTGQVTLIGDVANAEGLFGMSFGTEPCFLESAVGIVEAELPIDALTAPVDAMKPLWNAFSFLMSPHEFLDDLRDFRDNTLRRTRHGSQFIAMYYTHSDELRKVLLRDPRLARRTVDLLADSLPYLSASSHDGTIRIPREMFVRGGDLLQEFRRHSSPELRSAIGKIRMFLRSSADVGQHSVSIAMADPVGHAESRRAIAHVPGERGTSLSFPALAFGVIGLLMAGICQARTPSRRQGDWRSATDKALSSSGQRGASE